MKDAAEAKAALQDMSAAVKAESAAEVTGSTQAAAARAKDIATIQQETQALSQLANSAKQTNVQLLYGGRNDMTQHLSDMAQELNYTTLLNRQKWLGFSSVQQAMSYRQQMYNLALLENKAHFAGYLTADQYLGFLQRETMQTASLSAAIRDRTAAIGSETAMLLAHANALQGTHQTAGSLGEGLSTVNAYNVALVGLPDTVLTKAVLDDSEAMATLAAYRASLLGLPRAESTDITASATRLGGIPFTGGRVPVTVTPVAESAAPAGLAAAARMMEQFRRDSAQPVHIPVEVEGVAQDLAEVSALNSELKILQGEVIESHLELEGVPEDIAEVSALSEALDAIPDETHKVIYVDGLTGAVTEMDEFASAWDEIAHAEERQAEFDVTFNATDAETEEASFVNGLIEAARKKYEFEAGLDDSAALSELDVLDNRMVSATEQGRALTALLGQGGTAGGGGGGGPPRPPAPPGPAEPPQEPDPADAMAWNMLADAMERAGVRARAAATASGDAGTAAAAAGGAARGAGGWWGIFTRDLTLFGGVFSKIPFAGTISVWALALHTLIDFFIVLVPAVIAASVALGAFAAAAEPAALDVIAHLTGLHTALDALGTGADNLGTDHIGPLSAKMGTLDATTKPLPVTIRSMQAAMAPTVVTIFGAAINTLTGRVGLLQSITQKAGTWVEDMVIKIQQAVASHSNMLGPLIDTATNDMHILGGIGASILKLLGLFLQAGQMTHVSELLFEGIAYALSLVQKALNAVGPYALAAGIALFAVVHYGGLLSTMFLGLVTRVEGLTLSLLGLLARLPLVGGAFESLGASATAAFAGISAATILGVAAAIAAVGYAIYSAAQASSQAKSYVGGLVSTLTNDNASQGFAQIQVNLASMNNWMAQSAASSRNFVGNMAQGWSDLFKDASGFGVHLGVFKDLYEAVTGTNQQPGSTALVLKQMTAEQQQWTTTLETAAATTKQYGTTVQQSFALMDLAGVKVTDSLSTQITKVNDLVTGWLNMGVAGYNLKNGMNQLGAAIDAVSLDSEITNSQITKLTGDFTTFLGLVTSGENSFEAYATGIGTVATNAAAAGASMGGLNAASLTLRQSWESNLTAGQTLYNNLLLQNAAAGNNAKSNAALAASGRDIVNSLLAQGGATQESVNGAYALAQTMGYTGKATYDALLKWSGGNQKVAGTTADLNKQVGYLEGASANLGTDVLNLAAAISTNLNQAIAAGLVNMPAMTRAVSNFYEYVLKNRSAIAAAPTSEEISLGAQVVNALVAVYGTTPQGLAQAKNEFLATLSQMGLSRSQALALWAKDQPAPVKPTIDTAPMRAKLTQLSNDVGKAYVPPPGYLAQSDANQKHILSWFTTSLPHGAAVAWSAVYNGFDNDVWHPIGDFFNKIAPGWFTQYSQQWKQHAVGDWQAFNGSIVSPMGKFFTSTVPGWFTAYGQQWAQHAVAAWQAFNGSVLAPMGKFFTSTVPGWFTAYGQEWAQHAIQAWQAFSSSVVTPMGKFFTSTLVGWFTQYGQEWAQHAVQAWTAFNSNVLVPMEHFFTGDVPSWWNSFANFATQTWGKVWSGFNSGVLKPIENFFTSTLPGAMKSALVGGINVVIGDINKVIEMINSVTSIVGVHIGTISPLAAGGAVRMTSGSVPGTGDEDGTHIVAMGGEFMVRKPARMALQAAYGPDVMDQLNQADTWLGSGSRGNAASQRGSGHGRYASGGGILGNIANWVGDAGSAVAGAAGAAWHGITSAAADVAKFGEQAVFNAMWSVSGAPAEKALEALGGPGDLGAAWVQDVHNGVETWMTSQTTKANAAQAATGAGPAGGATGSEMANGRELYNYLRTNLFGGNKIAAAGAAASIWGESTWNPFAVGTGGRGLIGWTPPSTISDAAFSGGMATQLPAILRFVTSSGDSGVIAEMFQATSVLQAANEWGVGVERFGINDVHPEGVALASSFMASGGPVIAAVQAATASKNEQEAMALGAWLFTRLNPAATGAHYGEYGAWLVNLAKHKGFTRAQALNAPLEARLVAPAYAKGVLASTPAAWKSSPAAAALRAVASASATLGTHYAAPSAATVAAGWKAVTGDLGPAAAPPQSTAQAPSGSVAAYQASAARLYPDWEGALNPWKTLNTWTKRPSGVSVADWAAWLATRAAIENRVSVAGSYIAPLFDDLKVNPQELTPAMWSNANSSVRRWQAAMDVATLAKSKEAKYYSPIQSNLSKFQADVVNAANAWHNIWGTTRTPTPGTPGGSGPGGVGTPGAGGGPPGSTGATIIDLAPLISGSPVVPTGGSLGFGIATGGEVPSLSNVAAMFGGGMAGGGLVPNLFVPGMSATLSRQLSASASGELPRTMADAAAVSRTGMHVDQLTINNPVREETHQSITRMTNRMAFLAGRQMV